MKNRLFVLLCFAASVSLAQPYDVGFDVTNWTHSGSGITESGNELTIVGSSSQYRYAEYILTVDPTMDDLYFTVRLYMENITVGSEGWDTPKIRIENTSGGKLINYNISDYVEDQWIETGVNIDNFKNTGLTQVVLRIGMQNTSGTLRAQDPMVSDVPTIGSYIFPYAIPGDPSVTLNVNTAESHDFENDILSTNCHFTWAPYTWEDQNVKQMIYDHFPMQNLRFPGGTVANFYNWQTDDFYANSYSQNNNTAWTGSQNDAKFGYPGYLDVAKTLEGSSTLLFNVFSDDKATSQARLQARLDDGLDIKWVELGNENYFTDQAYGFVDDRELGINGNGDGDFTDEYIAHTTQLADWLREIKPDVKIVVNTHDDHWNTPLAAENYYDACVMHNYIFNNSFIMNQLSAKQFLGAYKTTQNRLDHYVSTFGNKPVIMSEWGLLSEMPYRFLQPLCVADNFLSIEKGATDGIVAQAGIHMLYHGNFVGEGSMIMHDGTDLRINPTGVVYSKLFSTFMHNKVYDAYSQSAELESDLDAVNAKCVDLGDSVYVFVVNKLPVASPLVISFDGQNFTGDFTMEHYTEDMDAQLSAFATDNLPWVKSSGTNGISVPANSVSIVTIQKSEFQDICSAPDLGGNTNLCGRSSLDLSIDNAGANKSYSWYKDEVVLNTEIAPSLTVNSIGTYKIVVDSAGCVREDEIMVSDHLPTLYLGNDLQLCEITQVTLDGDVNNETATYTWTKDNDPLLVSSSSIVVKSGGTYSLEVSAGTCASVEDEITISSNIADVTYDTLCDEGSATLLINESGDYSWYDQPMDGTQLSTQLTFEPTVSQSTTFYVQDDNVENHQLGLSDVTGTSYGGTTDYSIWGRTMYLNVDNGFLWEKANIFTNSTVDLVMTIAGTGGTFVYSENGIPNTGKNTPFSISPDIFIPSGQYTISLEGTAGKVFVQVSDKANSEIIDILEFGGTDGSSHYGYFYDWEISIHNVCSRTPVHAIVDPLANGCDITGITTNERTKAVYPNPSTGVVHLQYTQEYQVMNAQGQLILTGSGNRIDLEAQPSGLYYIKSQYGSHQIMKH